MKTQKRDSNKEKSKKEIFSYATQLDQSLTVLILPGTTTYSLNAYLNIHVKVSFFWKGIQQSGLVIEMIIQKNLKGLERMEVLITPHPI